MNDRKLHPFLAPTMLTLAMAMTYSMMAQAQGNATQTETEINPRAAASESTRSAEAGAANRPGAPAQMPRTGDQMLTDGQILQVVHTLNVGEIAQAELAIEKSENGQVKEVAELIIADHTSSNEQIETLNEQGTSFDLEDSDTSEALQSLAEETREGLADLSGAEFDCVYLQKQAQQHELALDTVGTELMPAVQDDQVKAFLTLSAPKLEHHLAMAEQARQGLDGCAAASPQANNR